MPAPKKPQADHGVEKFLAGLGEPSRRADCLVLIGLMRQATNCEPKMWGASIVGFGDLHYRYESGREGDTFLLGFASRKTDLTLYLGSGLMAFEGLLKSLGKHKSGKGCLYLRRLEDVDLDVLRSLLSEAASANAKTAAPKKSG